MAKLLLLQWPAGLLGHLRRMSTGTQSRQYCPPFQSGSVGGLDASPVGVHVPQGCHGISVAAVCCPPAATQQQLRFIAPARITDMNHMQHLQLHAQPQQYASHADCSCQMQELSRRTGSSAGPARGRAQHRQLTKSGRRHAAHPRCPNPQTTAGWCQQSVISHRHR
jgi:hypothetical protein